MLNMCDQVKKKMKKSVSTSADKPRVGWCFIVLKTKAVNEIHILYKNARNSLQLFHYKSFKVRKHFGLVKLAVIVREQNQKEEPGEYYKICNEYNDEMLFKVSLMNPFLIGDNSFSKMMVEMRCEEGGGGDTTIADFISRLALCKGFSHYDSNLVTPLGMRLGASDEEQEGFEIFLNTAVKNATPVTAAKEDAIQCIAEVTKRRKKEETKKKPLRKQERIEKFFYKELKDNEGVEREYINNMKGRADIPISKLEVCERVLLPIYEEKVKLLAKDMVDNFDPSAVTLTAVPVENDVNFDENKLEGNRYEIVHGRHRYYFSLILTKLL